MRIAICGDSFVTPVMQHPGTHFAEILQKKLDAEMLYLGRGGMSNGGICLQLEAVMDMSPDLVIFNTSYADRVEFALDTADGRQNYSVRDIVYAHTESVSTYFGVTERPNLIVDNLSSLLHLNQGQAYERWNRLYSDIDNFDRKRQALKTWFNELYTPGWKRQVDRWCLQAVTRQLVDRNIPFVMYLDVARVGNLPWFNESNNISDQIISRFYAKFIDIEIDPGYHTTYDVQKQIAEYLLVHMAKHHLIR